VRGELTSDTAVGRYNPQIAPVCENDLIVVDIGESHQAGFVRPDCDCCEKKEDCGRSDHLSSSHLVPQSIEVVNQVVLIQYASDRKKFTPAML
jgi:hypothetical protein